MNEPSTAPAFSTSASHIFEDDVSLGDVQVETLSDAQLIIRYEIDQTIKEIKEARFKRIALQFPDEMLPHAPRVVELMSHKLHHETRSKQPQFTGDTPESTVSGKPTSQELKARFYILGDTSYGACCIDEIAAEHIEADAIVHFGRTCLSPTARLPSIYAFTRQPLDDSLGVITSLKQHFQDKQQKIILMTDAPYQYALRDIASKLEEEGYSNVFLTTVQRAPESSLPNRSVPDEVREDPTRLKEWHIFHLAQPVESLLLTLFSRVGSIYLCPVNAYGKISPDESAEYSATRLLNRRYALVTAVSTASIIGMLINTLSVKNYLHIVDHVKKSILNAGKKSYTFVVGKINTAKVSNFSEIDAWVVIGCWESSLITSKDFYKPLITPFELELALQTDEERQWTGNWTGNYQSVPDADTQNNPSQQLKEANGAVSEDTHEETDTEQESLPPAYDLRTGKYISNSRPLQDSNTHASKSTSDNALVKRQPGDLMSIGGVYSPGADYLNTQRQWKGLGSDFDQLPVDQEGTIMQEGQDGIASGYKTRQADPKT